MKINIFDCVKKFFLETMMDFNRKGSSQKKAVFIQGLGAIAPLALYYVPIDFGFFLYTWCALNYINLIIEKFQGKFFFLHTIKRFKWTIVGWIIFWAIYTCYRMFVFKSISGETRLDDFIWIAFFCIAFTVYLFPVLAVFTKEASYKKELLMLGLALTGALLLS